MNVYLSFALVIRQENRVFSASHYTRIVISGLSVPTIFFFTLYYDLFSLQRLSEKYFILRRINRDVTHLCNCLYKVLVIIARF